MNNIEGEIRRVLDSYKTAVFNKDPAAFMALYDQAARVFDTWGVWIYEGAAAREQTIQQWFDSLGDETVAVSAEDVEITGGHDMAMFNAVMTYTAISPTGKKHRSMQNRLTWVLKPRESSWMIVHEHTSVPIGFHDVKAILQREGRP